MAKLEKLIGEVLDGKYHLDRLLGQGGMGAVFLATHLGTTRPVALKVIAPQFMTNEEVGERFRREAEAAGRLRHPNVVNVTDFGVAEAGGDTLAYLVMEYLDGSSLGEMIKQRGAMPLPLVVDIVEQICLAIGNAHQQGIIHRDLKPDNILLQPDQRGGYIVKVLDFGLAKLRDASPAEEAENDGRDAPSRVATGQVRNRADTFGGIKTTRHALAETRTAGPASGEGEAATRIQPPATAFGEEATRLQLAEDATLLPPLAADEAGPAPEEATRIFAPEAAPDSAAGLENETATRIQPAPGEPTDDEDLGATRLQPVAQTGKGASSGEVTSSLSVELTRVGSILGTPLYMSPEQCQGDALDSRSDIYSLGVIVYQMLAGETPFTGSMAELMTRHCDTPPPPVQEKRRNIPVAVARLVMSALEKEPEKRPATAEIFATALRATAETEADLMRQSKAFYYYAQRPFFLVSLAAYAPFALLAVGISVALGSVLSNSAVAAVSFYVFLYAIVFLATRLNLAACALILKEMKLSQTAGVEVKPVLKRWLPKLPGVLSATTVAAGKTLTAPLRLQSPVRAHLDYSLVAPVVAVEGKSARAALSHSAGLVAPVRSLIRVANARDIGITLLSVVLFPCIMVIMAFIFGGSLANAFRTIMMPMVRNFTAGYCWFILILMHTVYSVMPLAVLYFKARQAGGEKLDQGVTDEWQKVDVEKRSNRMGRATLGWFLSPFVLLAAVGVLTLVGIGSSTEGSLIDAIAQGRGETARRLLAGGRNPNESRIGNRTALMYAAREGQVEIAQDLLRAGAALEARDGDGDTALVYAAIDDRVAMIATLLAAGAKIEARNHAEATALMQAARKGRAAAVQALLAAGADVAARNKDGKTALTQAEEEGHEEVVRLLQEAGARE